MVKGYYECKIAGEDCLFPFSYLCIYKLISA